MLTDVKAAIHVIRFEYARYLSINVSGVRY